MTQSERVDSQAVNTAPDLTQYAIRNAVEIIFNPSDKTLSKQK